METSLILMTYNEEGSLERTVRELLEVLRSFPGGFELVIVDDGSRDASAARADELATTEAEVRVVRHPENQGLGGVYRTGFAEARGDWVTFFPADGQFPGEALRILHQARGDNDLVLGYFPRAREGLIQLTLSFVERTLYRLLFGFFPKFQGVLMVRTARLRELPLRSQGRSWVIVMEMILRMARSGARYVSVETPFRPRLEGHSKVRNLRTILASLAELFRLRGRIRETG